MTMRTTTTTATPAEVCPRFRNDAKLYTPIHVSQWVCTILLSVRPARKILAQVSAPLVQNNAFAIQSTGGPIETVTSLRKYGRAVTRHPSWCIPYGLRAQIIVCPSLYHISSRALCPGRVVWSVQGAYPNLRLGESLWDDERIHQSLVVPGMRHKRAQYKRIATVYKVKVWHEYHTVMVLYFAVREQLHVASNRMTVPHRESVRQVQRKAAHSRLNDRYTYIANVYVANIRGMAGIR